MYPMFKLNLAMFAHYLAVKWKDKLFHFLNIVNNFSTNSFFFILNMSCFKFRVHLVFRTCQLN